MPDIPTIKTPEEVAKQKRRTTLLLVLITIFALFGFLAFWFFGPNPKIIVSKQTTHLTTPLAADGYPDYHAVLLADMKKGVTPENNGAIPFVRTYWKEISKDLKPEQRDWLLGELGIVEPSPLDAFTPLDTPANRRSALEVLRKRLKPPVEDAGTLVRKQVGEVDRNEILFYGQVEEAITDSRVRAFIMLDCSPMYRPWSEEELPFLADWLSQNKQAIDQLVQGIEAENWYLPLCPPVKPRGDIWIGFHIPASRNIARVLMTRSMYYLGTDQYSEAVRDVLAILRLARHLARKEFLIDKLVASAIADIAYEQIQILSGCEKIPTSELRLLLDELDYGKVNYNYPKCFNEAERYFSLQITLGRRHSEQFQSLFSEDDFAHKLAQTVSNRMSVDWNHYLQMINDRRNKLVAISKLPTWKQQDDAIDAYCQKIDSEAESLVEPLSLVRFFLSPASRGKALGIFTSTLYEDCWQPIFSSHCLSELMHDFTSLSVAIAIYRTKHKEYPDSLDQLVPNIIPKLPHDTIQNNPFKYQKIEDEKCPGYLIYSVGKNGIDDGGSSKNTVGFSHYGSHYRGREVGEYAKCFGITDPDEEFAIYDLIPESADDPSYTVPKVLYDWPWEYVDLDVDY